MMNKDRYVIARKDSWKSVIGFICLVIACLAIGSSITLFDKDINNNVPHRSIDIQNDGTITVITGMLHRYNDDEYMKIKKVLILPSIDATNKTIQRMAERLDRYELYFNEQIRSK